MGVSQRALSCNRSLQDRFRSICDGDFEVSAIGRYHFCWSFSDLFGRRRRLADLSARRCPVGLHIRIAADAAAAEVGLYPCASSSPGVVGTG